MAHLFPIYLKLSGKITLVIGGGQVAERKISDLMECGCDIRLVSPTATDDIRSWAKHGLITWEEREFHSQDLDGVFLVCIATSDHNINQQAITLCRDKGILINAVDNPPNCDFFVPALLRRDSLAIAISTEGKSPLLARKVKEKLEGIISEEYGELVEVLGKGRDYEREVIDNIPDH